MKTVLASNERNSGDRAASTRRSMVCIPCYNSEDTIIETTQAVLDHTDADVLLVDDLSHAPLIDLIAREFPGEKRIRVIRPKEKVFAGGGKNLGLQRCLAEGYDFVLMMDSDVVLQADSFSRMIDYLNDSDEVVVGAGILPHGNHLQYSDTLINFSKYLPVPTAKVSRKNYLAGYAYVINLQVFRKSPCYMPTSIGGDDVVFFQRVKENFGLESLAMLNDAQVIHKPPRSTLPKAVKAQHRYARGFFSHRKDRQGGVAERLPLIHLLTPRFWLMVVRILRSGRTSDLRFAPLCWYLDFRRALAILHLHQTGFEYPEYLPNGAPVEIQSHASNCNPCLC